MQRRLRNVQKSMMHVQICCFANLILSLICRSRCRHRRRCLSFLMSHIVYFNTTLVKYISRNTFVWMSDYPQSYSLWGGTGDESSSCFVAHPHPHSASQKFACRPLITSLICITNLVQHQGHATSYVCQRT